MKTITLTQGEVALVDDADYGQLSRYKWFVSKREHTCYACRRILLSDGSWSAVYFGEYANLNFPVGEKIVA